MIQHRVVLLTMLHWKTLVSSAFEYPFLRLWQTKTTMDERTKNEINEQNVWSPISAAPIIFYLFLSMTWSPVAQRNEKCRGECGGKKNVND